MESKDKTMPKRDGITKSLWQDSVKLILASNQTDQEKIYDTLIIGGGITGMTTALLLQKSGQQCAIAEAHNIGFGTTGGTTAHLNTFLDTTYPEIDSAFNAEASKLMAKASKDIIRFIKENIDQYQIEADFEYHDAYLFSQNEKETDELKEIFKSSKKAGVDVEEVFKNGVPIDFEHALLFKEQAQFHPLKYIYALADAFKTIGGTLFENTLISNTSYLNGIHVAESTDLIIKAKHIVYATHVPPGINLLSLRNAPYKSYVLAVTLTDGHYPNGLAYDMKEPYHYFRTHEIEGNRYLIVGGEDHKAGHEGADQAFEKLENYIKQYYNVKSIAFKWSSQYYVPVDGLPYIGKMPGNHENTYVATGFNGNGMILGSLAAIIISDLILKKENPYAELLNPSRLKPISGFSEFVKENADVAYHFIADRLSPEVLDSINELERDEGRVVKFEDKKLAIYKDNEGRVNAVNPVCTHAGCIVNWNPVEKTWDCPCHGGRFSIDGEVLTGPPRKNLQKIIIDQHQEK